MYCFPDNVKNLTTMKRRNFLTTSAGASLLSNQVSAAVARNAKKNLILVGTGSRGTSFLGKRIVDIPTYAKVCANVTDSLQAVTRYHFRQMEPYFLS